MRVDLPYGSGSVNVEVPDSARVVVPEEIPGVTDVGAEIRRAMDNPIGTRPLSRLAEGKSDAVVIINDITRPAPSDRMLSEILADLSQAGIQEHMVTVVIASGNHRPNTDEEIQQMSEAFLQCDIEGIIATNTATDRSTILDDPLAKEVGGLSGAPMFDLATNVLT